MFGRSSPMKGARWALMAMALAVAACGGNGAAETGSTAPPTSAEDTPDAPTAGFPEELSALVEDAADESGAVTIFVGSGGITPDQLQTLSASVSSYYGFDIQIAAGPTSAHPQFIQQLVDESNQGIPPTVDVVATVNTLLPVMTDADLIAAIDWVGLGVDAAIVEPDTHGLRMHDQLRGIIYNPDLVDPADVPRRYEDLLEPRWRNKICAPAFSSLFAAFSEVLGLDEAKAYAEALVNEQGLTLVPTVTDAPARVASGEFEVCVGADSGQEGRNGAPVADAPLEAVLGSGFWAVVLADSPRPALATLVSFYLASDDGQAVLDETLAWGRFDVEGTKANEAVADGVEPVFPTLEWNLNDLPVLDPEFRAILGLL